MRRWLPYLGAVVVGTVATMIAWHFASGDLNRGKGAARFIGMCGAIGVFVGFFVTAKLFGPNRYARDGFSLSYRPAAPILDGYRELRALSISDLLDRLRTAGYAPAIEACDDFATRRGPGDPKAPLVGANIALVDPGVRGWVRVQLPEAADGQARALGTVEIWSLGGPSTEELALFTLRELGALVGGLTACRESSRLSQDPVAMLTAGLAVQPVHRK
jgi:hypothetical protein